MTEHATTQRIVVGVDGSASSLQALQRAAELAASLDCSLDAVTTWEHSLLYDPSYADWAAISEWSPEGEAGKVLATAIHEAFQGMPPLPIRMKVVQGRAARVLIRESKGARMLILGDRGHGGFPGLHLGSVSTACAAHAVCPVLITHAPKTQTARV